MESMGLLSRLCLPIALVVGFSFVAPDLADASSSSPSAIDSCKRKRRSKKRRARQRRMRRAKRAAHRKVTARTIARWQRKRLKEDAIVARAMKAGYKVESRREKRRLRKYRVRKSLIAKLVTATEQKKAPAKAQPKAPEFNLDKTIDPNEIDFDSVPPPTGIPDRYSSNGANEKDQKLDTSLRPSAFDPKAKSKSTAQETEDESKKKRVVFAAGK